MQYSMNQNIHDKLVLQAKTAVYTMNILVLLSLINGRKHFITKSVP